MKRIGTRRTRSALAVIALVATGLLATGAGGAVDSGSKTGGTLTIGLAEDPDALDPTLARTFVGRMVFLHMCEKLYDLNARLQIVPQLAAALPSLSGDKRTMTIRIRRGIRFNDGSPLNAAGGEDLARPAPHAGRIGPSQRDLADHRRTGREQLHGAAEAERALLAADGPARGPGRDDHVAEGARRSSGRGSRSAPVCVGAVQVHEPDGRRPDRPRQVAVLLRPESREAEPDRLPDHHRHERTRREPAVSRHQRARPHRVDRPACDPAGPEPARPEGDLDRLPGDLDQHREQERDRKAVREHRHAARRHAGRCGRRSSSRSTGR